MKKRLVALVLGLTLFASLGVLAIQFFDQPTQTIQAWPNGDCADLSTTAKKTNYKPNELLTDLPIVEKQIERCS